MMKHRTITFSAIRIEGGVGGGNSAVVTFNPAGHSSLTSAVLAKS